MVNETLMDERGIQGEEKNKMKHKTKAIELYSFETILKNCTTYVVMSCV